jgi:hypothetical protein
VVLNLFLARGTLSIRRKKSASHQYRAFHGFGQAKFPNGGSVLGLSQFLKLPQLHLKMMLCLKVVKIDSKIRNSLR